MTKKYEKDGFTIVINRVVDETPDLSYLQQSYDGLGDETEAAKYRTQDYDRLMALDRGEWYMMGITCSVRKQTSSNWADGGMEVGRASVWGIESDNSEEYLLSVEKDMEHELIRRVQARIRRPVGPQRAVLQLLSLRPGTLRERESYFVWG